MRRAKTTVKMNPTSMTEDPEYDSTINSPDSSYDSDNDWSFSGGKFNNVNQEFVTRFWPSYYGKVKVPY